MTHKAHPYGFRLGYIRGWKSRWFQRGAYATYLREDTLLREWLIRKLREFMVESVEIERSPRELRIIIRTPRPGLLIGRGGEGIERLRKEIQSKAFTITPDFPRTITMKVTVEEVKNPEANARVVARLIAQDLERRLPFRRVLKTHISKTIATRGVEGVRVLLKGRLDGSEMGRKEWLREGRIPLQTLRADVDFARETAALPYGAIGIKVWIYRGEIFAKEQAEHVVAAK